MARKGIRRTRTGCTTVQVRRPRNLTRVLGTLIKVIQSNLYPESAKPKVTKHIRIAQNAHQRAESAMVTPPGSLKQCSAKLNPSNRLLSQGAGAADSRFLEFFRVFLAPVLEGPLPHSFWTYTVPQMVHQEPGLRNAAVALCSRYQKSREDTQSKAEKRFAIGRYNSAIRQIALLRQGHLDTVVIACVVFMTVDILRGYHEQALLHYRYGKRILESYTPNAQIKGIFRQMYMFVLFTSPSGRLLPEKDGCTHFTQPF